MTPDTRAALEDITRAVAAEHGFPAAMLTGQDTRDLAAAKARHAAWIRASEAGVATDPIADFFNRHPSTIRKTLRAHALKLDPNAPCRNGWRRGEGERRPQYGSRRSVETVAKRVVDVSGKETSSTYTSTGYVSIPREPWPLDEVFDV